MEGEAYGVGEELVVWREELMVWGKELMVFH